MNDDQRTIVGGRSDRHRSARSFPRGIEILLKKAKADPKFRLTFLSEPLMAAQELGLDLTPTETSILRNMPRSGLEDAVSHTKVATVQLPLLRTAATAAALFSAGSLLVAAEGDAGETMGIEENPYSVQDSKVVVSQRLMAIQEALESYRDTHGEYPSTLHWVTENDPLEGLVPHSYLYDAWYQPFHYEGLIEDGRVVGYRIESVGADLEHVGDDLRCPIDPELHSFVVPNPITIISPQMEATITSTGDGPTEILATAIHAGEGVQIAWILDRVDVGSTRSGDEITIATSLGLHELVARDQDGNSDVVIFEVMADQ